MEGHRKAADHTLTGKGGATRPLSYPHLQFPSIKASVPKILPTAP